MKYVNVYRVETGSQGLHDNLPLRQGSGRCFVEHAELSNMCSRPTFSRPGVHGPIYRDVHMSLIRARRHDHAVATASTHGHAWDLLSCSVCTAHYRSVLQLQARRHFMIQCAKPWLGSLLLTKICKGTLATTSDRGA